MAGKHPDSSASDEKRTTNIIPASKSEAASGHQMLLDFMKSGYELIKVRSKFSKNRRIFFIDQDCLFLKYDGSRKDRWWRKLFRKSDKKNWCIKDIEEIREGGSSGKFSVAYTLGSRKPPNDHCLSIVYFGETLDLVAENRDIRDKWLEGLKHLHAQTKEADPVKLKDLELRAMFKEADKNGDNRLSANEIVLLLNKMNIEFESQSFILKPTYDLEEFIEFVESIVKREEINDIFKKYDNGDNYLTAEELQQFFHFEQKEEIELTTCEEIIQKHEHTPELKDKGWLSLEGFYNFLSSDQMCIQRAECKTVYQDMTQPLSHYFIDSSHNTYLEAGQINSYSTTEAYIKALRSGCRCVELDVWDGESEPIIKHGYAMTSELLFKEVVTVINTYAFNKSDYPLILSIENNCHVKQQKQMAQIMKTVFGNKLYLGPLSKDQKWLPTPAELMGKVIVKCKKIEDLTKSSLNNNKDDPREVELPELKQLNTGDGTKKTSKKQKIAVELSDCVVILQSVKFESLAHSKENHTFRNVVSLSEGKAEPLLAKKFDDFVKHNMRILTRIYPGGKRFKSDNYDPVPMWIAGCHMVALNYQTSGLQMFLNDGLFTDNGQCGYVLKPEFLRNPEVKFNPEGPFPSEWTKFLTLTVISGFALPKKRNDAAKSILDPYVRISIYGIPKDTVKQKTDIIDDNGFHPVWNKVLKFTVRCPQFALVLFEVVDYEMAQSDVTVAQYCVPFNNIKTGFRMIHLKSIEGVPLKSSTLFVHVKIDDK